MHDNQRQRETNQKWRSRAISVLVISALLILGLSLSSLATTETYKASTSELQAVAAIETPEVREWVPELPVRLVIPAIGVDAVVQYVGLDPEGTGEMAVPSNFTDVGWYKHGVRPGMRGSAVITGHLNGKEVPKAVFYDLHTLKVGDEVVIMSAERIEDIFEVVRIATYDHDDSAADVFLSTDRKKRLNLITCSGDWLSEQDQYNKRTVVFTELLTNVE